MDLTVGNDVHLVLMAGWDRSVYDQIRDQQTTVPIISYIDSPPDDVGDDVNVAKILFCDSIVTIRHLCREIGQDLRSIPSAIVVGDSSDPRTDALLGAWDTGANTGYCAALGGVHASSSRVAAMLESLHQLILSPPINAAAGSCDGVPGLVIGAGPSLHDQLPAISARWGQMVTACVNTSLAPLRRARLKPDICVICEAKAVDKTLDPDDCRDVVMVPGCHVASDTYSLPWAKVAPALSNEGLFGKWLCEVYDADPIWIGSSAVTLAAGTLKQLGCDPIILVGCDCAPRDDGEFYADDAPFSGTRVTFEDGLAVMHRSEAKAAIDGKTLAPDHIPAVETTGWDGEKRWTLLQYDAIAQWFEDMAQVWHRGRYNCSVGGVNITGWKQIPFSDVILENDDVTRQVARMCAILSQGGTDMAQKTLVELEKQRNGANAVGELAQKAASLCAELRQIQKRIAEYDDGAALIDAYTWGPLELVRQNAGDTPVIEHLGEVFTEIEQRSAETAVLISEAQERING